MADTEYQLGDVATTLLFENERVKMWELDLEPGGESDLHHHTMDYILVILEGERIASVPAGGIEDERNKYIEADVHTGLTVFVPGGGTETARNTGSTRYREILIELKP